MKYFLIVAGLLVGFFLVFSNSENITETSIEGKTLRSNSFNLTEVAEGSYVHLGKHVDFEHEDHDDIANIGFIIGDNCVAVIDTGGSVSVAKQLKQSIETVTDKPICYVINTHVHFDHILGNVIFKSETTQFAGHLYLAESIETNREFFLTEFSEDLGEYANEDGIIAPTILVEDSTELDLGNRKLTLQAKPAAHSDTDLIIIDQKTNTVWMGDLLFVERIPAFDGSLKGWLGVIEELKQENFDRAVPGHGPIVDWPGGTEALQAYLNLVLKEVRTKIAEGAFMEDIVNEVGKEEVSNWQVHEQHHKRNITKAFTELEWE